MELLLVPEGLPDGELPDDYIYATHALEDLGDGVPEEAIVPYGPVARKAATKAIAWLTKRGAMVSNHVLARHILKKARWLTKSRFTPGINVKKLCDRTLRSADNVIDQGHRIVFEKVFPRAVGSGGQTIVRVVVEKATGRIVTAFPAMEFKLLVHPLAAVFATTAAANVQVRFAGYLAEQDRLEEARENWVVDLADFFVGPETVMRDEDLVVFERILDEETAAGRASFEENVRRDDGMFRTMDDSEAQEFDQDVAGELAAMSPWAQAGEEA